MGMRPERSAGMRMRVRVLRLGWVDSAQAVHLASDRLGVIRPELSFRRRGAQACIRRRRELDGIAGGCSAG